MAQALLPNIHYLEFVIEMYSVTIITQMDLWKCFVEPSDVTIKDASSSHALLGGLMDRNSQKKLFRAMMFLIIRIKRH